MSCKFGKHFVCCTTLFTYCCILYIFERHMSVPLSEHWVTYCHVWPKHFFWAEIITLKMLAAENSKCSMSVKTCSHIFQPGNSDTGVYISWSNHSWEREVTQSWSSNPCHGGQQQSYQVTIWKMISLLDLLTWAHGIITTIHIKIPHKCTTTFLSF